MPDLEAALVLHRTKPVLQPPWPGRPSSFGEVKYHPEIKLVPLSSANINQNCNFLCVFKSKP